MRRLTTLISGALLGAVLVIAAQKYHVLRASDGFYVVPKMETTFAETYVDVRDFGLKDWANHKSLTTAIIRAKKESLFGQSAVDTLRDGVRGTIDKLLTIDN